VGHLADIDDLTRSVEIRADPTPSGIDRATHELAWEVDCPAGGSAIVSVAFEPWWDNIPAGIAFPIRTPPSQTWPATRLDRWRRVAPSTKTDDARLSVAVDASVADLASLRIFDRLHADRVVVAAGAPCS
jgi:hypothetical protein